MQIEVTHPPACLLAPSCDPADEGIVREPPGVRFGVPHTSRGQCAVRFPEEIKHVVCHIIKSKTRAVVVHLKFRFSISACAAANVGGRGSSECCFSKGFLTFSTLCRGHGYRRQPLNTVYYQHPGQLHSLLPCTCSKIGWSMCCSPWF
jgi:hypothetical protein